MRYTLWDNGHEVTSNVTPRKLYNVGIRAVAKAQEYPLEFSHEYIGFRLAQCMGLPALPGVMASRGSQDLYCSLQAPSLMPEQLPSEANIPAVISRHNELCCGIVLFDSWILNSDRSCENLIFNEQSGELFLIDHGLSLLAYQLDVSGTDCLKYSCLVPELRSLESMWDWWLRMLSIPDPTIQVILLEAVSWGLPSDLVPKAFAFLKERRKRLIFLLEERQDLFTKVQKRLNLRTLPNRTPSEEYRFLRLAAEGWDAL